MRQTFEYLIFKYPYSGVLRRASLLTGATLLSLVFCSFDGDQSALAQTAPDELNRKATALADLIKDPDQQFEIGKPISLSVVCDTSTQFLKGLCDAKEFLVPITLTGPGSGFWTYVARFRRSSPNTVPGLNADPKPHVALVDYRYISFDFGLPQWGTATASRSAVIVQTRYWLPSDADSRPTGLWLLQISPKDEIVIIKILADGKLP